MTSAEQASLEQLARNVRLDVLHMVSRAKSSHIGTSFSMAELLAVLYGRSLRVRPGEPEWIDRDRFILSKGHGCAALYAVLATCGFFPRDWLDTYYLNGSRLIGHTTHKNVPGVEVSTGSLGHGLSIGTGMALAGRRDGRPYRVVVLLSDGECDEGSTWEPVLFAPQHGLDNLIAIVDYNKIQSLGTVREIIDLEPLGAKWEACGWAVSEIDGHDVAEIARVMQAVPRQPRRPTCIIAHTTKGKGVSFMENNVLWHYRTPQGAEFDAALAELQQS